jgi:aspartyl-tRNA(Asn)/glutamyl-tRNA(Gln) amidotransferase subunit C
MKLTHEDVKHIALLARLGLTEEDIDRFQQQLSVILDNFEILNQVDTTDIEPTAQSIALQNVFREDHIMSRTFSQMPHNKRTIILKYKQYWNRL